MMAPCNESLPRSMGLKLFRRCNCDTTWLAEEEFMKALDDWRKQQ
jgi:hypothetical protein